MSTPKRSATTALITGLVALPLMIVGVLFAPAGLVAFAAALVAIFTGFQSLRQVDAGTAPPGDKALGMVGIGLGCGALLLALALLLIGLVTLGVFVFNV